MQGPDFEDPFDLVGDVLDGQFRVDRFAGEGDFTVVYKGHHLGVDAPVAIKCLNVPPTLDVALLEPFLESFRDGARLHYRLALGNLHIARSIAFGTTMAPRTGQSVPYLVREWLEGCSLATDFAERAKEGLRPRSIREVIQLLDSAAEALAYAHHQGVVHHSINPRNLFVVPTVEGRIVKVLDFGVAKLLNEHSVSSVSTMTSGTSGLRVMFPNYSAPEQLDRRFGTPGAATDVYAMALVIYEALSGSPVVPPNTPVADVLNSFQPGHRPTAKSLDVPISSHVEAVLTRALALEPAVRHGNVGEFWRDLRGAAREDSSIKIRPRAASLSGMSSGRASGKSGKVSRPPQSSRRSLPAARVPVRSTLDDTDPAISRAPVSTPSGMSTALGQAPLPERRLWLLPAIAGAALAASALLWGAVLFWRANPPRPRAAAAATATALASTVPSAEVPAPPALSAAPVIEATVDAGAAVAKPDASSTSSAASTSSAPAAPRPARKRESFSREEATRAFDDVAADLPTCAVPGGPRGPGSIRARFDTDGTILHVTLSPPYAGTPVGNCITQRFQNVTITPFASTSVAFNYVFTTIQP
ncbi:serine/threonine protein kinase [Pendulispora brunnea]|uniref:non-specific serine/threonine protein kinase n=1 Tax=Pendulispora brunnea TaxID=2905690 RepID=A0ABZ2KJN1_9BACT